MGVSPQRSLEIISRRKQRRLIKDRDMKQKTSKSPVGSFPVTKASIAPGTCFVPLPSHAEINSQWCAKAKKNKLDNGANSHVERFAQVMERIHATKKSFTFSELCYVCRGAEMEIAE